MNNQIKPEFIYAEAAKGLDFQKASICCQVAVGDRIGPKYIRIHTYSHVYAADIFSISIYKTFARSI